MNHVILSALALGALLVAGCSKTAEVQGEGSRKLSLEKPGSMTIERGGLAKAGIKIRRQDIAGDVRIAFTNLPRGVEVVESDKRIVGDEGSYTFRASETAELVENHVADVTASTGPGNLAVAQPFTISVTEGPAVPR
jgi:hypothetical protein